MTDSALADALGRIPRGRTALPSAAERVSDLLREQIVDGALRSGTRLTEETISSSLGFSRNTIREAFALLTAERLVVREPHRGVFVATPTIADVRDLYHARLVLEPAALEHGPGYADDTPGRLRAIVDGALAARADGRTSGVAQGNQEFHRTIVRLSGSRRVDVLMESVLAEMRLVFHLMGDDPGFHTPYLDRNVEIVDLLEVQGRGVAATALRCYLGDARDHLLGALGSALSAG
ncbi:GntR family transcriptional regulator [Janibacter melonis]|uniref:GntR family transcriptional regulator n=1 Tax=Janibacter TaxID=53457 RepID=UPI0020433F68|nr:GntR family transcriptional regulator [Janibacter melonis]MCM3555613.1 GntR family transcriptional regulator [Janibacter melonis]